jgi:hypothetical protein
MKTLVKYHGYFLANKVGGNWTLDAQAEGWTAGPDPNTFTSSTYFDLAGMSQEDKTMFIEAATVQHAGFTSVGAAAGDNVLIFDIMTSIPVDVTTAEVQNDIVQRGLGFPGSSLNFEHVIYQRMQRWSLDIDTNAAFSMLTEQQQSGSLEATASDRIYSYRVLVFAVGGDAGAVVPPARHLLQVQPREEPTFQHMMRLKRSYDLQQEPDRD